MIVCKDRQPAKVVAGTMTIIEMVPGVGRGSFGLGYAALHLATALHRKGANVFLASLDKKACGYEACEAAGFPIDRFIYGVPIGRPPFVFAPLLMRRVLRASRAGTNIVHAHGMWTYSSFVAGAISRQWKCPLVLSPHGELEPYALSISRGKKRIASAIFVQKNINQSACMCVLSERERESARAYGFTRHIEIVSNGVLPPIECTSEEIAAFRMRHNLARESRILLFLSRITPKKNLPLLLRSFSSIMKMRPEWKLLIAGPDERGHINEVRTLVGELGIGDSVCFAGPLSGRDKACAFHSASLFVLPSISEGLPIAVLEAMAYAKPLLITDGWNFPVAAEVRFGWRSSIGEPAFARTLLEAMSTSDEQLGEMGQTANAFVRKHFDWDAIAARMLDCYSSLISSERDVK